MTIATRLSGLALLCLVICSHARAETPWPLKSVDELKQLHGEGWSGVLRLTYRHSTDYNEPVAAQTVIGLGRGFIYREEDGRRQVVDFRLGRVYEVEKGGRFRNHAIEAVVLVQLLQRTFRPVSRLVDANFAPVGRQDKRPVRENLFAPMSDPFWVAAETQIRLPDDPPAEWETRKSGAATEFLRDTHLAVKWIPAATTLPPELLPGLRRAFTWFWRGHPDIFDKLAEERRAPQLLAIGLPRQRGFAVETFELERAEMCNSCEALPIDAKPGWGEGKTFGASLMPIMRDALAGTYQPVPKAEYLRRMAEALEQERVLEAFLWQLECSSQYATPNTPDALVEEDGSDVRLRLFQRALRDPETLMLRDAPSGYRSPLLALAAKVPAVSHVIGQIWLERLPKDTSRIAGLATGDLEDEARGWAVALLRAQPMVPKAYADLGDFYYRSALPLEAWTIWEIGHSIQGPNGVPELWAKYDALKGTARITGPQFF